MEAVADLLKRLRLAVAEPVAQPHHFLFLAFEILQRGRQLIEVGLMNELVLDRRLVDPQPIAQRLAQRDVFAAGTAGVKDGEERLMGFGHRVYKNYDPRAKIIKSAADDVFEATGAKNPLLDIALELERIALEDEYFISRKLYPNVDFYSGLIYEALGMPVAMFPVMFAIPRTSGWIAQWLEMVQDDEQKIARPRQIYTGARERDYVPLDKR